MPLAPTTPSRAMRIGELAERSGRSVHTIRYYEAQGLIPGVDRDGGGRRIYHAPHVAWLDLLDRLRRTGMSIRQLKAYAALVRQGEHTLVARQDLLLAHREKVEAQMEELRSCRTMLDRKLRYYAKWMETGERPGDWA